MAYGYITTTEREQYVTVEYGAEIVLGRVSIVGAHCTHIRNMYLSMNQPLFAHCPMCLVLPPHCPPQVIVIDPSAPTTRALEIPGPILRIGPNVVCTAADNALHTCTQIERFWFLFVVLYTLATTHTCSGHCSGVWICNSHSQDQ